jgi:hypothetical protein
MPEREISYRGETGFVSGYGLRHAVGAAIDLGFWLLRFWFPLRSTTYKNSSNA